MGTTASTTPRLDGRVARRDRGRQAVVDATLDLLLETGKVPSPEAVVQRAGVSLSSLFRYVEGLTELQAAAIERYLERYSHLFELPPAEGRPQPERVNMLVEARLQQYVSVAPVARLVRVRAADHPMLAEALHTMRHRQIVQVRHHFAPELQSLSAAMAEDLIHTIASLTSFEAWDLLHTDAQRGPVQIQRAWRTAITALLNAGPPVDCVTDSPRQRAPR